MATRYHQQSYAHTRPPTRRPPPPADFRPSAPPAAVARPAQRRPHTASPNHRELPHNESRETDGALHPRSSPNATRGNKRVSDIKSQEHNPKRDSEISNASSTGSANGRKRTIGQWQLGRTVGKGGCSTVRLVRHVVTGQQGAVKIISRKMAEQVRAQSLANLAASQERSLQDLVAAGKMMPPPPAGLMREIAIMKLLDHPNIVKLYDVWENHNELYLVMEYVPGGELFHYVEECRGLDEKETVYIFRQIVAALLYCHRLHIHHRDLKPENILLDRENAQIKLVDFGMAALQPEGKQLTTACGSPHYAAPEVIRSKPYDGAKADVWSCGVILYVMLTGTTPFNYDENRNLQTMYTAIQAADYYMPPELTYHAKDLLRKIFVTRPERRISMDEIWEHPLLHKYDRDFGYEGELAKKEKWIGPSATLDMSGIKHEDDIDKEILRNMRTLWHSVPQQILVKKLLSTQANQEQFFYAALAKHKRDHLENYTGGVDGLGYAASDYQHHKVESAASAAPKTKQTSQSSYSIMNNEHLRSSSVAERLPSLPSEPSQDMARYARPGTATRTSHVPRGAGHKRGNSATSALRVDLLKKANHQARTGRTATTQRVSPAPRAHSRSASRTSISRNSRQSLTSSVWPSSPPVVVQNKANLGHKRNVSFQHLRKNSVPSANASQNDAASSRYAPTPEIDDDLPEAVGEYVDEDDETNTAMSSPTRRVIQDSQARKAKVPVGVTPRSKVRQAVSPVAMIKTEVRKVSHELEKACQEAFFNSSFASTAETGSSTEDRNSPYDTPPSSVSNHAAAGGLNSPTGRPLPAVPTDTPNTFIARTLEETRKKLVARSNGGEADAARINEVLASLEKIMPIVEAERRTTSAPEPKSATDLGFLPIITEEPLPDTLRVGKGEPGKGPRSFTAPGHSQTQDYLGQRGVPAYQTKAQTSRNAQNTVRMVQQSSPAGPSNQAPKPKRDSAMEKEVYMNRPKTSDGMPQDDNHLQVPNPYDLLLRKKSYDSAIGLKQDDAPQIQAQEVVVKKESSWFRRWKKSDKTAPVTQPQTTEQNTGVQSQYQNLDDRPGSKQKPSMLKRDKQPPQALDLHNMPDPGPGPPTDGSEFPMRRVSEVEKQGFSKWFGKLQKKDEPIRAIEVKDPQPSPGISSQTSATAPNSAQPSNAPKAKSNPNSNPNSNPSTAPISPLSGNVSPVNPAAPPAAAVNAQSWFARFFRLQPQVRVTAFNVPRSRARTEVYRLLREFQHHGLADLCYFPQENAISGRVEKSNALGIKPVAFRVEFFVVLQNGRKSGLSLARWTQVRGAASAFEKVVDTVEGILTRERGVLVREEARRRELVSILI